MLEAVVGGGPFGVLDEQAGHHGRLEAARELLGLASGPVHPQLDLAEVLQAEVTAEHRREGEERRRLLGQVGGSARDECADRRGHHPLGVARQVPGAVDLLDQPLVAVGLRHRLDDEGHPLGLGVHHHHVAGVNGSAERLAEQLARLGLREPVHLHAPQQADAVHVGDQVHGLGHLRELLGPDREHQEDRARAVRAHDVPDQSQTVVVGPLEVVDQHRERPLVRERPERDGPEVERSEQAGIGGQRRETRVVPARHRVEARGEGGGGPGRSRGRARIGRADDRAHQQERTSELLVRGDGDRREAILRRELVRGEQQSGLADPGLALEAQPGEPAGPRGGELLADRVELRLAADDRTRGAAGVEQHRRDRLEARSQDGRSVVHRPRRRFSVFHPAPRSRCGG